MPAPLPNTPIPTAMPEVNAVLYCALVILALSAWLLMWD